MTVLRFGPFRAGFFFFEGAAGFRVFFMPPW
jgi:hypothetical protein